jgi:hypothetical protein
MTCRLLLLFVAGFALACGPTIGTDDGAQSMGGSEDDTTSATSSVPPIEPPSSSSESESGVVDPPVMPPLDCDGLVISMPIDGLGQARIEPGTASTMRLRLSKHDFECGGSFHSPECGGTWNVTIRIPPEAQQVGTYDLADFDMTFSDAPEQREPACSASSTGGGRRDGTMEILAWEDACVAIRFSQVNSPVSFDFDGELVASTCP